MRRTQQTARKSTGGMSVRPTRKQLATIAARKFNEAMGDEVLTSNPVLSINSGVVNSNKEAYQKRSVEGPSAQTKGSESASQQTDDAIGEVESYGQDINKVEAEIPK